jgi:hypothetical protein
MLIITDSSHRYGERTYHTEDLTKIYIGIVRHLYLPDLSLSYNV